MNPTNLADPFHLLDSLFVRNKNQHRNQLWWKPFSLLRAAVRKFVILQRREDELRNPVRTKATGPVTDAKETRRRFELEAQLRRERELVGERIREVLGPRCYVVFSGIVADTQFANLGLVLMGVLSEIAGVVGLPQGLGAEVDESQGVNQGAQKTTEHARSLTAHSLHVTGPEKGTLVERVYDSDDLGEVVERQRESSEVQESTKGQQTGDDTRPASWAIGTENIVDNTTLNTSTKAQAAGDGQPQPVDIEMEEESAPVVSLGAAINQRKLPATKDNRKTTQAMRDRQTRPSTTPSQISSTTPLPPPPQSTTTTSTRGIQQPSTKSRAPYPTTEAKPLNTPKKRSGRDSPGIPEESMEKSKKSKSFKKIKKKKNAIDDMFAGFG